MGTNILMRNPSLDDFWGKENCSEVLVLSRPDIIKDIHAAFFAVGCDVVETNTFGGTRVVLGEFDLKDRVAEINIAAAKLAKEVAAQFSTKERPRFVAGSIGPTTKLPSLGHISFDEMAAAYEEQAAALIEGGVDLLLVETAQDLLQAKIGAYGALEAMRKAGKRLPLTVQVTLQESGTMLLGTEIGAALTALEPFDVDIIGINCATGPKEMNDAVRYLGVEFHQGDFGSSKCRPAAQRRRTRRLQARTSRVGQVSQTLRSRLRCSYRRRMLRHHSRSPESRRPSCLRRRTRSTRGEAYRRSIERLHFCSARSRAQAPDRRGRNEHDHSRRALPQSRSRQEVRRHPSLGKEASERRIAHARSVLCDCRRRRKGLHHFDSGARSHARPRANSRRLHRGRCC